MATAAEFRAAARHLDQLCDEIVVLLDPIAAVAQRPVFDGGTTPWLVHTTLNAAALNVIAVLTECGATAVEARRRAAICDQYATAVQTYHRAAGVGPYPARPASWVDV
jgi:hypothetical protein